MPALRSLFILTAGLALAASAGAAPLDNPGFEAGDFSGWTTFGLGWRIGTGEDAATGASGAVCDVLPGQSGEPWRGLFQNVPVASGSTYTAGVDLRTVNLREAAAWLELQWLDENDTVLNQLQSDWFTIDQPFTAVTLPAVTAPPDAVAASIRGIVFIEYPADEPEFIIFDNFRFERQ